MTDVLHRDFTGQVTLLTVRLQVVSANSGRPRPSTVVHLWPCDDPQRRHDDALCDGGRCDGGLARENGARGAVEVRISDGEGWAEFDGVLPAGRWPHLHFEIHGRAERLALPGDACFLPYAPEAVRRTDLAAAFGAGAPPMIASVTGDARRGLVATRTVRVGAP
jgi:protocatechuate 3,4-dioxygenase beta subunit